MITENDFKKLFPRAKDHYDWVLTLNEILPENDINTEKRIAAFLAQCGHESGGWRVFSENLNYSAKALNIVFPKYFKRAGRNAEDYHRQPEKIANVVYANRMGNRSIESGDGWSYRGRGLIQLTGYGNYNEFSMDMDNDAVYTPHIVSDFKDCALKSALWYWNSNNLNYYADNEDIKGLTKRINGGYNGLEDRIHHYKEAMHLLGSPCDVDEHDDNDLDFDDMNFSVLKRGSRGEGVEILQKELRISPCDGIFGLGTEKAVKKWQSENGLIVDGIVGPKTLERLLDD